MEAIERPALREPFKHNSPPSEVRAPIFSHIEGHCL